MAAKEQTTLPRSERVEAPQRITQKERAEQRRRIASAVNREKLTSRQAAKKFGVSVDYVRKACVEHGVRAELPPNAGAGGALEVLADLAKGMPASRIAADRNISRQRVNQVKHAAENLGLLPKLKRIDAELAELRANVNDRDAAIARRHAGLAPRIAAEIDQTSKTFAVSLKYYRLAAGLVPADAAALAGISRNTWYGYETGNWKNPPLERIVRMAAALGVTVIDLLRDMPTPPAAKVKAMKIKSDSSDNSSN